MNDFVTPTAILSSVLAITYHTDFISPGLYNLQLHGNDNNKNNL